MIRFILQKMIWIRFDSILFTVSFSVKKRRQGKYKFWRDAHCSCYAPTVLAPPGTVLFVEYRTVRHRFGKNIKTISIVVQKVGDKIITCGGRKTQRIASIFRSSIVTVPTWLVTTPLIPCQGITDLRHGRGTWSHPRWGFV